MKKKYKFLVALSEVHEAVPESWTINRKYFIYNNSIVIGDNKGIVNYIFKTIDDNGTTYLDWWEKYNYFKLIEIDIND